MNLIPNTILFGYLHRLDPCFYDIFKNPSPEGKKIIEYVQKIHRANLLGYLPFFSQYIGARRLYASFKSIREGRSITSLLLTNMFRGVCEILFLGLFLFFIDMIFTLGRFIYFKMHPILTTSL